MTEGGDFCFTVHLCPHAAALLKDPPTTTPRRLRLTPLPTLSPSRNGTQLRVICKDDAYDFNLQETRDLPYRVVIKPVRGGLGGGMAGVRGRQDQHLLLLAKRSKAGPVPLPLTSSVCLSPHRGMNCW